MYLILFRRPGPLLSILPQLKVSILHLLCKLVSVFVFNNALSLQYKLHCM